MLYVHKILSFFPIFLKRIGPIPIGCSACLPLPLVPLVTPPILNLLFLQTNLLLLLHNQMWPLPSKKDWQRYCSHFFFFIAILSKNVTFVYIQYRFPLHYGSMLQKQRRNILRLNLLVTLKSLHANDKQQNDNIWHSKWKYNRVTVDLLFRCCEKKYTRPCT